MELLGLKPEWAIFSGMCGGTNEFSVDCGRNR